MYKFKIYKKYEKMFRDHVFFFTTIYELVFFIQHIYTYNIITLLISIKNLHINFLTIISTTKFICLHALKLSHILFIVLLYCYVIHSLCFNRRVKSQNYTYGIL